MGKRFSFANLLGHKAEEDKKEDETGQDAGATTDGEEEDETSDDDKAEDGEDDDTEEEEKSTPAAKARTAERQRIGRILSSQAATGRLEQALHLALNTSLSPIQAIGILKTAPTAQTSTKPKGSPLADAMSRQPKVSLGADGDGGKLDDDDLAKQIAASARRR
ncbi:hypothetical protein N825_25370 [Skermanella stibiiresistens SB22]|uniref:Uncharacterized protein n=1 Tax=Skermanella stibiiresistens SB22 TaxID=1385369 RepID=W9GWE5_9PROT|nr:hypothetical protein [Skermanella stibiiresistens]EWY36767.1 hypothetical protein N825_25370 [Skermanella stibiiresistens SB22]